MRDFAGILETHWTVRCPQSRWRALEEFSEAQSLKCTHIVLDRGVECSQPMLSRHRPSTLSAEREDAHRHAAQLAAHGFPVIRIKIEASADHPDAPSTDQAAKALSQAEYFEHHVKLLLSDDNATEDLRNLAESHHARFSRNALRTRPDGKCERFVTQRCHQAGRATAQSRLDALVADLSRSGQVILEIEREFAIYDSDLSLDRGWLDHA